LALNIFPSEIVTIVISANKCAKGKVYFVANNCNPLSFFHICISKVEREDNPNFSISLDKDTIKNMVDRIVKETEISTQNELAE